MKELRFEWDDNKARLNLIKHGVTFEEAKTVFYDECALVIMDPEHSEVEECFVILGFSANARILVVCHCYRDSEGIIRIISARKATRIEASHYKR